MTKWTWVAAMSMLFTVASALEAAAQAPPAPVLVAPANGAALVQPIGLEWGPVVDADGPIGSYTWQVSSTSTFGVVIASGYPSGPDLGATATATHPDLAERIANEMGWVALSVNFRGTGESDGVRKRELMRRRATVRCLRRSRPARCP